MDDINQGVEYIENEDQNIPIRKKEPSSRLTGFLMNKLQLSEAQVNIILISIALLLFLISIALFSAGSFERTYPEEDRIEQQEQSPITSTTQN